MTNLRHLSALIFLWSLLAAASGRAAPAEDRAPGAGAAPPRLPWLSARGTDLVDAAGHKVVLRGVSLGGWLVEEIWMQPIVGEPPAGSDLPPVRDHVSLDAVLRKRLGEPALRRMKSALREAWVDESDFDRVRAAGFNHVRVPFLYDLLEEPDGLAWLDRANDWAAKRGLYVILDLHGAPGRQSKEHHTGESDKNLLFKDPVHVAHTERVWREVARRYRDRPEVAGYDLLNEPMGAPDVKALYAAQTRLYRAIRDVDARHVILIEDGYTGLDHMPAPAGAGWKNVMASPHHYAFNSKSEEDQLKGGRGHVDYLRRHQQRLRCPLYVGEFNQEPHGTPQSMAAFTKELDAGGFSWAIWTYKVVFTKGTRSMWGVYRNPAPIDPLNPYLDSEEQWVAKCKQVRTERLERCPGLVEALSGAKDGE
jgi:hypothetical protein